MNKQIIVVISVAFTLALLGCSDKPKKPAKLSCTELSAVLQEKQAMNDVKALREKDCPVLYREEWLQDDTNRGAASMVEGCPEAWRNLRKEKMLVFVKSFIKKQCQ